MSVNGKDKGQQSETGGNFLAHLREFTLTKQNRMYFSKSLLCSGL